MYSTYSAIAASTIRVLREAAYKRARVEEGAF